MYISQLTPLSLPLVQQQFIPTITVSAVYNELFWTTYFPRIGGKCSEPLRMKAREVWPNPASWPASCRRMICTVMDDPHHRVDIVLGFFFSRPNSGLGPPTPSPASECVPPLLVSGSGVSPSRAGEGVGIPIRTRGQTQWYSRPSTLTDRSAWPDRSLLS
jgi:hypothetical protein